MKKLLTLLKNIWYIKYKILFYVFAAFSLYLLRSPILNLPIFVLVIIGLRKFLLHKVGNHLNNGELLFKLKDIWNLLFILVSGFFVYYITLHVYIPLLTLLFALLVCLWDLYDSYFAYMNYSPYKAAKFAELFNKFKSFQIRIQDLLNPVSRENTPLKGNSSNIGTQSNSTSNVAQNNTSSNISSQNNQSTETAVLDTQLTFSSLASLLRTSRDKVISDRLAAGNTSKYVKLSHTDWDWKTKESEILKLYEYLDKYAHLHFDSFSQAYRTRDTYRLIGGPFPFVTTRSYGYISITDKLLEGLANNP